MALYTILNGSDQQLSNVNAEGVDVDMYSWKRVDLTSAELATLLNGSRPPEVAVMRDTSALDPRVLGIYRDSLLYAAVQSP